MQIVLRRRLGMWAVLARVWPGFIGRARFRQCNHAATGATLVAANLRIEAGRRALLAAALQLREVLPGMRTSRFRRIVTSIR